MSNQEVRRRRAAKKKKKKGGARAKRKEPTLRGTVEQAYDRSAQALEEMGE